MPDARSQTYLRTETMLKTAMGPAVVEALDDPAIVEVMVNPDGKIWIDAHGDGRMETGTVMPAAEAERVIRVVGSHIGQEVDRLHPIVSAELPGGGERFEGVIPPVTTAPCFSIRKPAARVFTLDDYVETGVTSAEDANAGWPVFQALSMSRASPPRTSPTIIRSGRSRSVERTRSAMATAPA